MTFEIDISNRQSVIPVDCSLLHAALVRGLEIEQVASAVLSISIVDDASIHILNRDHLGHDYPTDVISFQLDFTADGADGSEFREFDDDDSCEMQDLEDSEPEEADEDPEFNNDGDVGDLQAEGRGAGASIEGEIIASAEMAANMAADGKWSSQDELTLYVVHGLLHICGYDDLTHEEQLIMRARERAVLSSLGLNAVYAEDRELES